ncbi:MAG: lamin tail domain-containing protein, partial [Chthoniobacteraceae bacterium]
VVQFYVQGADGFGAAATYPPGGATSRALYKVGDGGVSTQPVANKIRLIMTAADAAFMHNPIHSVSNARFGATLIANDREVFYGVRVRLRSSPYGRQGNRTGWNLDFDPEQPFRGTETEMVLDGAFNMPCGDGTGWIETTLGPSINEMLFQRVAERAGGIPSEIDDVAFVATPYYESRTCQLRLRRYGNTALDDFTPNGGDGSLFKQEIIYYPTATVDGNVESLKNAYSTFKAVDILSQGTAKDAYRFNYLVQNHAARDDFAGIVAMCAAFSGSNANLYAASDAALDLESWTRTLALNALTGLADTYNQHLPHNIQFLARPGDGRVMLLPWDMDHAFYFATNFNIYGGDAHRVKDLIADPRMKRRMAGHLHNLCNTSFSNAYLDPWIDHYNAVAGKTYNANFKNWVSARRTFVLNQLNTDWPATPFAITTNGGANFSVNAPTATVQGSAWIDVHHIRKAGAVEPLDLVWLGGNSWRVVVPLGGGGNLITLLALNYAGAIVGTDSITITNTGPIVPAAAGNLVVSEIMYHPADPTPTEVAAGLTNSEDFEFIELMNVGTNPVDLTDAAFTDGITFTFPGGTLAPGARLLLVRNAAAFAQRYGAIPTSGVYTGALNNAGDHLLLLDRGNVPILDFSYDDAPPWPVEADGTGRSLTLLRPGPLANPALATSWRVSVASGGSPGAGDALSSGSFPSSLDYALAQRPVVTVENGYPTFTWRERIGADDVAITPQLSSDLVLWNADPGNQSLLVPLTNIVNPDGTRTMRIRTAAFANAISRADFRLRVQLQ